MADFASYDVLGVPVSVVTPEAALEALIEWSRDDVGRFVCIRDVHGVMRAQDDALLMEAHHEAAMVTPDGMPLAIIGRQRGLPVARTTGPDLMLAALKAPNLRHFLYGGGVGVIDRLQARIACGDRPIDIVGSETPPFRELSDAEIGELAKRINSARPDIVWIGLSTPKQELLMRRLAPFIRSTLVGVGAAFDIHAGLARRPPTWVQDASLEGVYRFLREPRRLWHRYLVLAPRFLVKAGWQELRRR